MAATPSFIIRLEIEDLLAAYWHEVDANRGQEAHLFFTEDAVYRHSGAPDLVGQAAIRAYYASRRARGPRVARHVMSNVRVTHAANGEARCNSIVLLFAADGAPVLPSAPPILIADVVDDCQRQRDGQWRFRSRLIDAVFKNAG